MVSIEAHTIGQAHDNIMRVFLKQWKIEDAWEVVTEDKERTIEIPGMKVRVLEPWKEPKTSPALDLGPKALEIYVKELTGITSITGTIKDFEYTYGNRLWDYPTYDPVNDNYWGDGAGHGINQITESIINRLVNAPTSRRAIAVTWVAEKDIESREPPCLQFIQCLIRGESKLNLHAVFRSHDMAGGWGPNVYALETLQKKICDEINGNSGLRISQGYIETYSVSAHIYTSHDQVTKFRRHLNI